MNRFEVLSVLDRLNAAFAGKVSVNDDQAGIWIEFLEKYDADLVNLAADEAIETCRYAPKIADLLEIIKKLSSDKVVRHYLRASEEERRESIVNFCKLHNCVNVREYGIIKLEDAVFNGREWVHKMQYCTDTLGADRVTAMLREVLSDEQLVKRNDFPKKEYKEILELMLQMSLQDNGVSPAMMNEFRNEYREWQKSHIYGNPDNKNNQHLMTDVDAYRCTLAHLINGDEEKFYEVAPAKVLQTVEALGGFELLRKTSDWKQLKQEFIGTYDGLLIPARREEDFYF